MSVTNRDRLLQGTANSAAPSAEPLDVTDYEPEVAYPHGFPLRLDVARQRRYARWRPLVKWLLAMPHAVALIFVGLAMLLAYLPSVAVVLVTGRYPLNVFRFMTGGVRWFMQVIAYLYLLTDAYPPFSLRDNQTYTVRFDLDYPPGGRVARWRPLAAWLLVIPQILALSLVYISVYLMVLLGLFSILFTRTFPPGVFDFIVQALRFHARVGAYALFMTERYPTFML
jgi:hypothetical protein